MKSPSALNMVVTTNLDELQILLKETSDTVTKLKSQLSSISAYSVDIDLKITS